MGIDKRWGLRVGSLPAGPLNKISDVPGVTVGHRTLAYGRVQTGVTALLPHQGDIFHEKLPAASCVINGFGKSIGLVQVGELGTLETPILLTNTLSVGTAATALVRYMLERCHDICVTTGSVNPLVFECNDSGLNDIRGLHVTEADALDALARCRPDFAEGAVGAGRGMRCHGLKGGIGSASRRLGLDGRIYHMGALVLTNHGRFEDLVVAGTPIVRLMQAPAPAPRAEEDKGSVIVILATDIPLTSRQLGRVARRAIVGLSRTGSYCGHGSGEIALAFSTGNRIPHTPAGDFLPLQALAEPKFDLLFRAAAECVEESVLSSMLHAEAVTGQGGVTARSLAELLTPKGD